MGGLQGPEAGAADPRSAAGVSIYYQDDLVTLHHGECLEIDAWIEADVLVTDPPYGIGWARGGGRYHAPKNPGAIAGDLDTNARDEALAVWGTKPGYVFGAPQVTPPVSTRQVLAWVKAEHLGMFGSFAGWRRDWEAIYLIGTWTVQPAARSGVIKSGSATAATVAGHPHAKPVGLLEQLIECAPPGVIADPFAGSGSTLLAARNLGRKAIGVEVEERYCEIIARRLAQGVLL
jgi:DNA modification methylase